MTKWEYCILERNEHQCSISTNGEWRSFPEIENLFHKDVLKNITEVFPGIIFPTLKEEGVYEHDETEHVRIQENPVLVILDYLGNQSWELISYTNKKYSNSSYLFEPKTKWERYIFKREKKQDV